MSRKRAHAVCGVHGCQLISPTIPPFCPKCRASTGGKSTSQAKLDAAHRNIKLARAARIAQGLAARQRLGDDE